MTIRERFKQEAELRAWKAFRRHGEKSYQFRKAMKSRWIK